MTVAAARRGGVAISALPLCSPLVRLSLSLLSFQRFTLLPRTLSHYLPLALPLFIECACSDR